MALPNTVFWGKATPTCGIGIGVPGHRKHPWDLRGLPVRSAQDASGSNPAQTKTARSAGLSWRFFDCAHEGIRTPNLLIRSGLDAVDLYKESVSVRAAGYRLLHVVRPQAGPIVSRAANRCRDVRRRTRSLPVAQYPAIHVDLPARDGRLELVPPRRRLVIQECSGRRSLSKSWTRSVPQLTCIDSATCCG